MMQTKFKAALLAVVLLSGSGAAMAEQNFWQWLGNFSRQKEVRPVDNKTYADECGSCHYAYPPGLLPSKSWAKLLDEKALSNHFGEDATLDKDALKDHLRLRDGKCGGQVLVQAFAQDRRGDRR